MKAFKIKPRDSHSSFAGKAVEVQNNGWRYLVSYETVIMVMDKSGNRVNRFYDDPTATTLRHISAFCGKNKKEFLAIPYRELDEDRYWKIMGQVNNVRTNGERRAISDAIERYWY